MSENDRYLFLKGRTKDYLVLLSEGSVSWYVLRYDDNQHRYPSTTGIKKSLARAARLKMTVFVIMLVIFGSWIFFVGMNELPSMSRPLDFLLSFTQLSLIAFIASAFLGILVYNLLGKSFFVASASPEKVHRRLREVFLQQEEYYPDFYHIITISRKVSRFRDDTRLTIPEHWMLGYRVMTRYLRKRSRFTVGPRSKVIIGHGFRIVLQGYFELKIADDKDIVDRKDLYIVLKHASAWLGRDFTSIHESHDMIIRGARFDESVTSEIKPSILERLLTNKPVLDPSLRISLVEIKKSSKLTLKESEKRAKSREDA